MIQIRLSDSDTSTSVFHTDTLHTSSPTSTYILVTLTRSKAKTEFNHVLDNVLALDNVLGRDVNSFLNLSIANEGTDDIFESVTLSDDTIDTLTYEDINNTGTFLPVR